MAQKSKLIKNRKFSFIQKELIRIYGEQITKHIIISAEKYYSECEMLCAGASDGEWLHLNGTILPTVAVYKALRNVDPDRALEHTHDIMMELCNTGGAAIGNLMRVPGVKTLFMWILPKMALKLFGPACGFQFEHYHATKKVLQMDMTACPYCRYAIRLGCPELIPVFCDSDFATYGNLPGIRFERNQTLGTGGSCCDFKFSRE